MGVLESLESLIMTANGIFWGVPLFILVLGIGLILTIRLGFIQVRLFPLAVARLTRSVGQSEQGREGDISPIQALTTALSGTMGIGNIAGVSTAIVLGGPGAIFWMWMTAVIGMATKYSEAVLALKYRTRSADGTMAGGPMYYIERGLKSRWLALAFAACGTVAMIGGGGMAQANSIAQGVTSGLGIEWAVSVPLVGQVSGVGILIGLVLAVATGLVIVGGIKRIGLVASWVIPILSVLYVGGGLLVIALNYEKLPEVIALIFRHAFSPYAVSRRGHRVHNCRGDEVWCRQGRIHQRGGAGHCAGRLCGLEGQIAGRSGAAGHAGSVHRHDHYLLCDGVCRAVERALGRRPHRDGPDHRGFLANAWPGRDGNSPVLCYPVRICDYHRLVLLRGAVYRLRPRATLQERL